MRSVVYEIAREAMLLGFFTFWIFWALSLIVPALVSAVMSAVGAMVWGFMKWGDEQDAHRKRVEDARAAPRFEVRDDLVRTFFGGDR